jgi:hypothetical protein
MLISSIVLIVLRLFSIQWLLEGLALLPPAVFGLQRHGTNYPGMELIPAISMLLASVVAWCAAPALARRIAGQNDATVSVPVPPLRELYVFAFVFLGLYFAIRSIGDVAFYFHYALVTAATAGDFSPERQQSGSELVRSLITLVGGALCIIFRNIWAGKLSGDKPEA